jgi:hypothetical protein
MKRFYPVIKSKKTGKIFNHTMSTVRSSSRSVALKSFKAEYSKLKNKNFELVDVVEAF